MTLKMNDKSNNPDDIAILLLDYDCCAEVLFGTKFKVYDRYHNQIKIDFMKVKLRREIFLNRLREDTKTASKVIVFIASLRQCYCLDVLNSAKSFNNKKSNIFRDKGSCFKYIKELCKEEEWEFCPLLYPDILFEKEPGSTYKAAMEKYERQNREFILDLDQECIEGFCVHEGATKHNEDEFYQSYDAKYKFIQAQIDHVTQLYINENFKVFFYDDKAEKLCDGLINYLKIPKNIEFNIVNYAYRINKSFTTLYINKNCSWTPSQGYSKYESNFLFLSDSNRMTEQKILDDSQQEQKNEETLLDDVHYGRFYF